MTDRWAVQLSYRDVAGRRRTLSPRTAARLRELIGDPTDGVGTVITRPGRRLEVGPGLLRLEDGSSLTVSVRLPALLPLGYHTFEPRRGEPRRVIVSPARCHLGHSRPTWGWGVQLFAIRSGRSWGIGDLGDLGGLTAWASRECGAGFVMVNPLAAVGPTLPQQPSPYFPTSRRFRNPIYIRVEDVPGAADLGPGLDGLAAQGRALNRDRRIDRDAAWQLKLQALEAIWSHVGGGADFDRWLGRRPDDLVRFATWCTLAERFGRNWRAWPPEVRRPDGAAVTRFAADHRDRVRFHAWLQWLVAEQLAAAAAHTTLVHDLPVGVDPNGADAWEWQDVLASGVTVGAPPDEFNTQGQDWGLIPFVPWRLRLRGYQPFIDTIRAVMSIGGGLRIDHVMGLFRLWWIPPGGTVRAGGYVRYPSTDLLDIIALESQRARATVVGEDLGTVEPAARRALAGRGLLTYRVLWFEKEPPDCWPTQSVAAVTTHDLPTVAGLWAGSDLEEQRTLGLAPNVASTAAIRSRLADRGRLADGATAEEAIVAAHGLLAQAPSVMRLVTLEDAVAVAERPNMPGADGLRPNWSLALPIQLGELRQHPLARRLAGMLSEGVATTP